METIGAVVKPKCWRAYVRCVMPGPPEDALLEITTYLRYVRQLALYAGDRLIPFKSDKGTGVLVEVDSYGPTAGPLLAALVPLIQRFKDLRTLNLQQETVPADPLAALFMERKEVILA